MRRLGSPRAARLRISSCRCESPGLLCAVRLAAERRRAFCRANRSSARGEPVGAGRVRPYPVGHIPRPQLVDVLVVGLALFVHQLDQPFAGQALVLLGPPVELLLRLTRQRRAQRACQDAFRPGNERALFGDQVAFPGRFEARMPS